MLITKLRRVFFWTIVVIAVLLLIARLSLPFMVQNGFSYWFEQQQIDASIEDVSFDFSDGSLLISGISGEKQGSNVFKLESLSLKWSWAGLLDNHARIIGIGLDGLTLAAVKQSADTMIVAGIDPAKLAGDETVEPKSTDSDEASKSTPWKITLEALSIKAVNLCYADKTRSNLDYCSQFGELAWRGDLAFDLAQLTSDVVPLFAEGSLTLKDWLVHNNHLQRDMLKLTSVAVTDISIDTLSDLSISQVSIDALQLLHRNSDKLTTQVSGFGRLSIDGFSLKQLNNLHIAQIKIEDHELLLLKGKDEQLEINEWIPGDAVASEPERETTASEPFQFVIDRFVYESEKSIAYIDQSLGEPFGVNLKNTQIEVTNIDSTQPDQDSEVSYSAQYADHGQLKLAGVARPLAAKPSFAIEGDLKGLDLRDVSAFTKSAIGHSIKSGQLDAKLKLVADNSVLDSRVDLSLYHFQLKSLSKADAEKLDSAIGFPLNPALSMLRDRDDSIHLSIPVTGDLQNPDFDPNKVLKKAFTKAMTSAVVGYFTPFGLVTVADTLFTLATALRFDPVKFESASSEVDSKAEENLSKIAKLMKERPGVHITLCSFTNTADRQVLLPDTADEIVDTGNPDGFELSNEQRALLTDLANQRSARSKQSLVDAGIDADRLVLCEAEHTEGEGLAGVELSI